MRLRIVLQRKGRMRGCLLEEIVPERVLQSRTSRLSRDISSSSVPLGLHYWTRRPGAPSPSTCRKLMMVSDCGAVS